MSASRGRFAITPDDEALRFVAVRGAALLVLSTMLIAAPLAAEPAAGFDPLRGVGNEQSLLGSPPPYRDPYRSALDANETRQTDLMRVERIPDSTMKGDGYAPLPGGAGRRRFPGAAAAADAGGPAAAAKTPQDAAQTLYLESLKGPKAAAAGTGQQIYRMPW